ncbi:universal stress protein [Massilia horti]|uniref:Universal stress protein n=1 Tax=Massilia horti TaxID=2562153 RepID=A0A4Y9T6Y7_9BURK|nr:universal stress protein [Massilia horti]TFW33863.1 universal stress protein [Massilia horti]
MMFKTILVPICGSDLTKPAEDAAIECARRAGGSVVVLSVTHPGTCDLPAPDVADPMTLAEHRLTAFLDRCQDADIPCQCSIALAYAPCEQILQAAAEFECDAIFIACDGECSATQVLPASEAQKLLACANMPVMVFR